MLRKWQVHVTHPRYFGLFNPSVTVASVVADLLVAMYNPQLAAWRTSPAANEIERHTLTWLAGKFGLPDCTVSNFTSGGEESNFSAVVVALAHSLSGVRRRRPAAAAASPVIYLTGGAHHGFYKIARMTGLGHGAAAHSGNGRRFEDGSGGSRQTGSGGSQMPGWRLSW